MVYVGDTMVPEKGLSFSALSMLLARSASFFTCARLSALLTENEKLLRSTFRSMPLKTGVLQVEPVHITFAETMCPRVSSEVMIAAAMTVTIAAAMMINSRRRFFLLVSIVLSFHFRQRPIAAYPIITCAGGDVNAFTSRAISVGSSLFVCKVLCFLFHITPEKNERGDVEKGHKSYGKVGERPYAAGR